MKESYTVNAEARADQGKGASRRLRREGKVPAILYGGKDQAQSMVLSHNEMAKHLQTEAFYSHILTLKYAGASHKVVLKDLQRNPVNENIIHVDFLRVQDDVALRMHVPLHFKGGEAAPGVKTGGGVVEHHLNQVTVVCLPKHLPEFIEIDISAMELNQSIHLSQLTLPEGVALLELKHGNDQPVVSVHMPRAIVEEEPVVAEAATAEVPALAQKTPEGGVAAPGAAPAAGDKKGAAGEKKDEKKK
jgi:large subunit ribosomal protein L25